MPGANCSIFEWPVSLWKRYTESTFHIPIESNDALKNRRREELINVISKGHFLKTNQWNSYANLVEGWPDM